MNKDSERKAHGRLGAAPGSAKRGLVCCFCGEGWGYEGEQPTEALLKEAVDHEAQRPRNPYLSEISRLRSTLERIRSFPVHSEPVGEAYAMQDIADAALNSPNGEAHVPLADGGRRAESKP